ncbi:MAG TPA: cobalamin biosynthesis protein, partial [Methanosarcina sp.]|nr:cobalamin biosynthesis protein [Methanosarcina sp.]
KGVAEPAALALSKEKQLICRKKVYGRVTIAIAR